MDLVNSRKLQNRKLLQEKLESCIEDINHRFHSILTAPISITLGDEWQLITHRPEETYNLIHEFQQLLWEDGLNFYAGIGIGELSTEIYEDVRKMDGPCFHMAREALNTVKENSHKKSHTYSKHNNIFLNLQSNKAQIEAAADSLIDAPGFLNINMINDIINTLIENTEIIKYKMTDKQKRVYKDYYKIKSYRKVIELSKVNSKETISSISQKLNSAEYFTIEHNHKLIRELFTYFIKLKEG